MNIAGSIVLYNTPLEEVIKVTKCFLACENVVQLHVIDNSKEDKVSQHLHLDSRITYYHYPENLGYGTAHNIGMRASQEMNIAYHVVLNTDLSFEPSCIRSLYEFMESRKDVGMVMPKIVYPDGRTQFLVRNNPTPYLLFARRFFKNSKKAQTDFYYYQNEEKDYEQPMFHIPFLSGCFMFIRTSALADAGLFDERIFMYTEDADLSRRMLQVAETAYWPKAVAVHDFKGGVHKSWRLTKLGFKAAFYYFSKWGWNNSLKREVIQ
jgi:GT2 family glycosyltransferase